MSEELRREQHIAFLKNSNKMISNNEKGFLPLLIKGSNKIRNKPTASKISIEPDEPKSNKIKKLGKIQTLQLQKSKDLKLPLKKGNAIGSTNNTPKYSVLDLESSSISTEKVFSSTIFSKVLTEQPIVTRSNPAQHSFRASMKDSISFRSATCDRIKESKGRIMRISHLNSESKFPDASPDKKPYEMQHGCNSMDSLESLDRNIMEDFQEDQINENEDYPIEGDPMEVPQLSKSKKKKGYTALSEMMPENLTEEKATFFEKGGKYNPNFLYMFQTVKFQYAKPHTKYLVLAKKIMKQVLDEFGSDENFIERFDGRLLNLEETTKAFTKYIQAHGLEDCLELVFSEKTVAPTSVLHDPEGKTKVIISLPIIYRENRINGVLNHEIGTHYIRKFNDRLQIWHKNRKKYEMKQYIVIEEGLAALNDMLDSANDLNRKPYLYKAALHYYSAYMASVMSFEQLYQDLEKYMRDPEKRWRQCLRVKRGITDTSNQGGMYKDQVYLRGALEILKNRKKIDFVLLHTGKMNLKDFFRLQKLCLIKTENTKIPIFLMDLKRYKAAIERIAEFNFGDKVK